MRDAESGAAPYTCDLNNPGNAVDEFTVEATSGATTQRFTNNGIGTTTQIPTTAGPSAAGTTIVWQGRVTGATFNFTVDKTYRLNDTGRYLQLDVTITNNGTTALSNVYYLRNGDPDHGSCSIGTVYATVNDVVRQPPAIAQALVLSATGTGATPRVVVGMGAFDSRARAHVNPVFMFNNTNPSGTWAAPRDPAGVEEDAPIALVFREPTLAAGASVTFRLLWVWGPDNATVTTRMDRLACVLGGEGAGCADAGGAAGTCHGGSCCTTCWDGTACAPGTTIDVCGTAGAACASCNDGSVCTTDACTAGVCDHTPLPGGACDDGWYCTTGDVCSSGMCTGAARVRRRPGLHDRSCDGRARQRDRPAAGFCAIAGAVTPPATQPAATCHLCDPACSGTAWCRPAGTACDDGLYPTITDVRDAAGACAGAPRLLRHPGPAPPTRATPRPMPRPRPRRRHCYIGGSCYGSARQSG